MPTRNPVRWEIPTGLSFDLADLGSRSEEDFHPETLKGHIELLMFRALKAVSGRVDKTHVPPEEFRQLLEAEFQSMSEIHPPSIQQVVEEESKVFSEEGWKRLKEERLRDGIEYHRREYESGKSLGLGILGPKLVPGGGSAVLRAVTLSFDDTLLYRQRMLSLAQEILTEDFLLNERSNLILTEVLNNVVASEPLYEFSVAELFELYGELVNSLPKDEKKRQLNSWINRKGFKRKVGDRLLGKSFTAEYRSYSQNRYNDTVRPVPLPFAVRNTLAHQEASNPNVALLEKTPHGVYDSVVILRAIKSEYFSGP